MTCICNKVSPSIVFPTILNDMQFIREKTLSSDWITVTGAINAVNDTVEYVPANGKTFFLYSAKITLNTIPSMGETGTATDAVKADLKIDSVVKDITSIGVKYRFGAAVSSEGAAAWGFIGDGRFDCTGLHLVGNGSKAVEIENIIDNGSASATLIGWIEDT